MKKKKMVLIFLIMLLLLVTALGMVACSNRQPEEEEGEDPVDPIETNYDINYYLSKINDGLNGTIRRKESQTNPMVEYAVSSEYTVKTGEENYTIRYDVVYGDGAEKNKYYLRLFDNINHIDRVTVYYDSADLYLYSDNGRYKIKDFNKLLLYTVFSDMMDKIDMYRFFYGDFMTSYFRRGSLLTNAFRASDCIYNNVGSTGEAVYFQNGDFSVLISTLNARIEAMTEGIGTSFDALTYNMLGFRLSKFIEYSLNSINVEYFRFLLDNGNVYDTTVSIKGRMLNGSDYFLYADYKYDLETRTIKDGETLKSRYTYSAITPGTGSFEGQIVFPTVREDAYSVSLDYDLNTKDNTQNNLTFRIYDQNSTETTVSDKYGDISEFLSIYYTNEILYVNAEGLCNFIGTPVELESLHLPKVYITDLDLCSALQIGYGYLMRVLNVLTSTDRSKESKANRDLFESLMDAISSPDLQTLQVTVTEELIKDIREDDTPLAFLVSRWLTGKDDAMANFLPKDFFQLFTLIASYKFVTDGEDLIILQGIYDQQEYFNGTFYRVPYSGIVLPKDLNDLYYTLFSQPEVITLDYDVSITPYNVDSIDASQFFGIFMGDGSGRNTPCVISSGESIAVRGKVSESYSINASGDRVTLTTVYLSFYKKTATKEELLMTVISDPTDLNELLISYYGPIGTERERYELKYKIDVETIKSEMQKLTDEDNLFLSGSNIAILVGLISSLGGNSETYVRDNKYVVTVMANDEKDPVKDMIGIADTFTIFRMKVSFGRIDLSSVTSKDYSSPYVESIENISIRSIYSDNSNWKQSVTTYVNGIGIEMYLTYTDESVTITTGQNEYYPTAYLFGKEVKYRVYILDITGTYLISDLLTGESAVTFSYAYAMQRTGIIDGSLPSYLLVIDPAYTKKLPSTVDVRYENFEVGSINCTIEGFLEGNITRDGYNLSLLAGDYKPGTDVYTIRIGNNSIKSYTFPVYIAVINRNVISIKKNETDGEERIAYINSAKEAESVMARESKIGTEQVAVINKVSVPIVGEIIVDPYTYAMKKISESDFDLITGEIKQQQMRLYCYGYYETSVEKDEETSVEIEYNKYYNKEGYNYINILDRIESWSFNSDLISWQGGTYYATALFGSEEGYAIPIAIRVVVERMEVQEVRIDEERNSSYTIDYLIKSTYTIPTTSTAAHTVVVVFKNLSATGGEGKQRTLIPMRSGTLSEKEYYEDYLLGSLNWAGTDTLSSRITVEGTSSLFGRGQNATSETTADLGSGLGIGVQKVTLNVLQPNRRLSGEDEKTYYLTSRYQVEEDGGRTIVTPQMKQISVSKAKYAENGNAFDFYEINPYDFTAALPDTVWLYVDQDYTGTKVWKNYSVNWQTTDPSGNELNIIKEQNGKFILAYPSTAQRDLVVYGCIGDGNGIIWVTMVVRNLYSELKEVTFYSYEYEKQDVTYGSQIPMDVVYYEYFEDGYAITQDERAVEGKYYYLRQERYTQKTDVVANSRIQGEYYELTGGEYVLTADTIFASGKRYFVRDDYYTQVTVIAGVVLTGEVYYEHIENGYGMTEDISFRSGKEYYLYVEKTILPATDYLYVDPYVEYDTVIPTRYVAILGSGERVTSEDVDEEGNVVGLVWYAVIEDEEYPLVRSGKYLVSNQEYNLRYDENGKFIFPWNARNIGLKCYIKGNGDITNEAVVNLIVRVRELYTVLDESERSINFIDIYNNDDPYVDEEGDGLKSAGVYTGTASAGFLETDRYDKSSTALLNRLTIMYNAQSAGEKIYIGVRFSNTASLYSLPVEWDLNVIERMITSLTSTNVQSGLYLTGRICPGTINEQFLCIPFSVKSSVLTAVKPSYANTSIQQGVYAIVNDTNDNVKLETEELISLREYDVKDQYLAYIGSSSDSDLFSTMEYSNIIYFDITKAYALTNNRYNYFCTPYEYFTYLFNNLTLIFQGGVESQAIAGDQLVPIGTNYIENGKATTQAELIEYFNRSVLGLLDGVDGKGKTIFSENDYDYSYSFITLKKFSQGSAVSRTLVVIRSAVSETGSMSEELLVEPYNKELKTVYVLAEGYPMPEYVEVSYRTVGDAEYTVRYETTQWQSTMNSIVLNNQHNHIMSDYIDVTSGNIYYFSYTLPCSKKEFRLTVRIPKKDMGKTGFYSDPNELYPIENGEIQIENPFEFFYYDMDLPGYVIDESKIPTNIYAYLTDTYVSSTIDGYELSKWTFHYIVNRTSIFTSDVFMQGGRFLLATCNYSVYNSQVDKQLELYINVAKLSYYGIEDVEGTTTRESEENLLNDITIDPYSGYYDSVFNMPRKVRVMFSSLIGDKGTIVSYTFTNITYTFSSVYNDYNTLLQHQDCSVITFNQRGHTMSILPQDGDRLNTIYLTMAVPLGDGTTLGNGLKLQVSILARTIDRTILYNTVYYQGMIKNYGQKTYLFAEAAVEEGKQITSNNYYETDGNRFYLTSDATFVRGKKYFSIIENEGLNEESATSYVYTRTKVTVNEKVAPNTYYVYNGLKYVLTSDTSFREGVEYYLRSDSVLYRNERYYEPTPSASGDLYEIEKALTVAGEEIFATYYLKTTDSETGLTYYLPEAPYYFVSANGRAERGATYYTAVQYSIGAENGQYDWENKDIKYGTYYIQHIDNSAKVTYVAARGKFVAGQTYYSFTSIDIKLGKDLSSIYDERNQPVEIYVAECVTFQENTIYYVPSVLGRTEIDTEEITRYFVQSTDKTTGNVRFQKATGTYDETQRYYVMREASATVGYRLAEQYYVYTAGRYELTQDTVFNKTTQYYIFRKVSSVEAGKKYYGYFDGYEGASYHSEATVTEVDSEGGEIITPMSVYYIDPYNSSTFRLPTEVYLKFVTTDDFKAYPVRGWAEYNVQEGTMTDFVRYDGNAVSVGNARFYQIVSSESAKTYYGYFMPQAEDYNGGMYRVCGYITVGEERQYFHILIVVLNRSLRIKEELGHSYSIVYDYEDPVGGLLSDISAAMREDMFVPHDSYYLEETDHYTKTDIYGRETEVEINYSIPEEETVTYRNGNSPVLPTILWQEEWEYNGQQYTFNGVSLTGYSGEIYGNVYAPNYNVNNLYARYYDIVTAKYKELIEAWMWDLVLSSDYSGQTKVKIDELQQQFNEDIIIRGYDLLSSFYKGNTSSEDTSHQYYYRYITESYYNEMLLELRALTGNDYNEIDNKREIVLYMYQKMYASHQEWVEEGSASSKKSGRPQIFEDWEDCIASFMYQNYTPNTDVDEITSEISEYMQLKAYYYDLIANQSGNVFLVNERKFNLSYYTRYERKLVNCIARDVWDKLFDYSGINERLAMRSIMEGYSGTETRIKSSSLIDFMKVQDDFGVAGEEAKGQITLPTLEYNKLLDENGQECTTIYFNPFDFTSINDSYTVEFVLDYSVIYRQKEEKAEKDLTAQYRDEFADVSLEELENVLAEKGIDAIAPIVDNGNGTYTNKLTFKLNGVTYDFTYENYRNALANLVAEVSGAATNTSLWTREEFDSYLSSSTVATKYHTLNKSLWESLLTYYKNYSMRFWDSNIYSPTLNTVEWNNLRDVYVLAASFAASEGEEEYAIYYSAVVDKIDEIDVEDVEAYQKLTSFIQENYPVVAMLANLYGSNENIMDAYSLFADELLGINVTMSQSAIYKSVRNQYSTTATTAGEMLFSDVFSDFYGDNVSKLIVALEDVYYNYAGDTAFRNAYNSLYESERAYFSNNLNRSPLCYHISETTSRLYIVSSTISTFVLNYVINTYFTEYDAKVGEKIALNTYYVLNGEGKFVLTADERFVAGTKYYLRSTPYSTLLRHSEEFGYRRVDIEESTKLMLEQTDTDITYFITALSYDVSGTTFAFYPTTIREKYGFPNADSFIDAFVAYQCYNRFLSVNTENAATLRNYVKKESGKEIKTKILKNLIENGSQEAVKDIIENYFKDAEAGLSCLPAHAFIVLMDKQEEREAGSYQEDYQIRTEQYVEDNFYKSAKTVLDELVDTWPKIGSTIDFGPGINSNYRMTTFVYNHFYKYFIWRLDGGGNVIHAANDANSYVKGYDLAQAESGELYPTSFQPSYNGADNNDYLIFDAYFESKATKAGYTYTDTIRRFYRDYALRSILYFYDNVATASQKRIVAEVATMYVGETFSEEACIEKMLSENGGNGAIASQDFFLALLGRSDLGEDYAETIYNCYYAFYLEESYAMLSYAVDHLPREKFTEETSTAIDYGKAIYKRETLSTEEDRYLRGYTDNDNVYHEGLAHQIYRTNLKKYVLTNGFVATLQNEIDNVGKAFISDAYDIYYETYKDELDDILDFIVHSDAGDPRYARVNAILEKEGKAYPMIDDYYKSLFTIMLENIMQENLEQFYDAVEKGIVNSLYEELYDSLKLLTLSQNDLVTLLYVYLRGEDGSEIEDKISFLCDTLTKREHDDNYQKYIEKLSNWWESNQLGLSVREKDLIKSVYYQQYYSNGGNQALAYAQTIKNICEFVIRVENYCDGNLNKGYLTKDNILYNDYSEMTIEYKTFFIDLILNNDEFMNGVIHEDGTAFNSMTLMQASMRAELSELLKNRAANFMTASAMYAGSRTDYMDIIVESLTDKGWNDGVNAQVYSEEYAIYQKYMQNALTVLSHTSIYVNMQLGVVNPLQTYVSSVYRKIVGVTKNEIVGMENGITSEDETKIGTLTLRYFVINNKNQFTNVVDYESVLNMLVAKRYITTTFYSADHLSTDSSQEELRHVVYFDSGRTGGWAEYVAAENGEKVVNTLNNARVYYANAYKTRERIEVTDIRYYTEYIDNYIHDFTSYSIQENKNLPRTSVVFSNAYSTNDITFELNDLTKIQVYFDETSNIADTITIDVLNPVLPDKVRAKGFIGEREVSDLGYITNFTYSDAFYTLPFNRDEATADAAYGFSRVITGDNAYKMYVYGDSGRTYELQLNVNYFDRSIDKVYMATPEYTRSSAFGTDQFEQYYLMYVNAARSNVFYIDPSIDTMIKSDYSGYIMPSEIYVTYGNGNDEHYTDVVWDMSGIDYSLAGTNGFVNTRIVSYRLQQDVGYYYVYFDYSGSTPTITITQYSDSNEEVGESVHFDIDGDINWNMQIYVENKSVASLQSGNGSERYGSVYENTQISELRGVIDCTSYKINQFYPEYPEDIRIVFDDKSHVNVKLSQSDWKLESASELEAIVQGNENRSNAFTASFRYMGYKISARFGVYDNIDLTNLTQGGEMMNGGTIYLIRGQGSAEDQIKKFYSTIYFNFGTVEEPNWKKVPLYIDIEDIMADDLAVYRNVKGTIGAKEEGIIDSNILFTIEVVSPKLFATMDGNLNNYVEYDYYCYAHNVNNEICTSYVDTPPSLGSYFAISADSSMHFEIQVNDSQYDADFINGIIYVPVLYDMSLESDTRIALDDSGIQKFRVVIQMPLHSYLNTDIAQSSSNNVKFSDPENNTKGWKWGENTTIESIVWPLGVPMAASDLPQGKTIDGFTFDFLWDLSDVNVNLATDAGYVIRGYYFTDNNRWINKELTVFIEKVDKTQELITYINGSKGNYIGKTYDAKYFKLDFDATDINFLRSDGTYGSIAAENFYVEYKPASYGDESWSTDNYPINAGDYHIRIVMKDYNYLLKYEDEEGERDYLLFYLTIERRIIDISNLSFIEQDDENRIAYVYNGETHSIVPTNWFKTSTEREELYLQSYNETGNSDAAKAYVFDVVYNRSSAAERNYLDSLCNKIGEANKQIWVSLTEEARSIKIKASLYDSGNLSESVLPYVEVDNWFGEGEKYSLYRSYMTGNGPDEHAGILYTEVEARALAYAEMYSRVNSAAQEVIRGWFAEARRNNPKMTEQQIYAYVYEHDFPEKFVICEINLHIQYKEATVLLDGAPSDVGAYTVEVSIVPEENDGNYTSSGESGTVTNRTLVIEKDENVRYEISNAIMTYDGRVQNPNVYPVTDANGNLAEGVEITYEYIFDGDKILTVVRTAEGGARVKTDATTVDITKYTYAGIRDVGSYRVRISVKGGKNFYDMSDNKYGGEKTIETVVNITPADIFIELDDIVKYYLDEVVNLSDYLMIHTGAAEFTCMTCGAELRVYSPDDPSKGVHYVYCENCGMVKTEVNFDTLEVICNCDDCLADRAAGRTNKATMTLAGVSSNVYTYEVRCQNSEIGYLFKINRGRLLGSEAIGDLGELVMATNVKAFSPVGEYVTSISGLKPLGEGGIYTELGESYYEKYAADTALDRMNKKAKYGDYRQLLLIASGKENSLYSDSEENVYADIINMFSNYNFYIKTSSTYLITTVDDAVGVSNDEELAAELSKLSDGDTAIIYLSPKMVGSTAVPYNKIVIDKDIDLTLIGYYKRDVDEKIYQSILSGIVVKKGSLTLRILEIRVEETGANGITLERDAGTIRIEECLFSVADSSYRSTTGIYSSTGYTEKINILSGTQIEGFTVGIRLLGGQLEIKDGFFRYNNTGIQIVSMSDDISMQQTTFENHTDYAVYSNNEEAVILNNVFRYNRVAIRIPAVLNDDMYKNNFTDENGIDTNTTDIEESGPSA